jgi:hypothetical protein
MLSIFSVFMYPFAIIGMEYFSGAHSVRRPIFDIRRLHGYRLRLERMGRMGRGDRAVCRMVGASSLAHLHMYLQSLWSKTRLMHDFAIWDRLCSPFIN